MTQTSPKVHKLWSELCAVTEGIRERLGLQSALDYLVSGKLFTLVGIAEQDSEYAENLPVFVRDIKRLFSEEELREYLRQLKRTTYRTTLRIHPRMSAYDGFDNPSFAQSQRYSELARFAAVCELLAIDP
jgi:hypothetical protein